MARADELLEAAQRYLEAEEAKTAEASDDDPAAVSQTVDEPQKP